MDCYFKNQEATSETFNLEGWLKTGDLCNIDDDGFLYVVDRLKELIKYKGYQVAPAELEALLITHPDILDAAVIPFPDKEAGQYPMAYVTRKLGSNLSEKQVIDFISKQSSDEEGEDGEKRKKEKKKIAEEDEKTKEDRKGVMEQIREKFPHGTKTEDDTPVIATLPVKEETVEHPEEKKGLMEKIKEKLPGHSEKPEDSQVVDTAAAVPVTEKTAEHPEEKKGLMEKIKEKLPGYHAKSTEEEEEKKEKESDD
ncbi:hypothetical protein F2Q68_00013737 [Brassica cretica]|uniref:AMP-binding enzyme C-terminal domain-containing protein n=1 Tax=Brassica cretica TaxID=69181 RepID=A0A8S9HCY5_BRACR|nr:hypothetical protein F2Q68_00013737 [Brassica cretica]